MVFLRDTEYSLINYLFEFNGFLIYTPLMFFVEFLAKLIFYTYLRIYIKGHKKGNIEQFMNIQYNLSNSDSNSSSITYNYIHNEISFTKQINIKVFF